MVSSKQIMTNAENKQTFLVKSKKKTPKQFNIKSNQNKSDKVLDAIQVESQDDKLSDDGTERTNIDGRNSSYPIKINEISENDLETVSGTSTLEVESGTKKYHDVTDKIDDANLTETVSTTTTSSNVDLPKNTKLTYSREELLSILDSKDITVPSDITHQENQNESLKTEVSQPTPIIEQNEDSLKKSNQLKDLCIPSLQDAISYHDVTNPFTYESAVKAKSEFKPNEETHLNCSNTCNIKISSSSSEIVQNNAVLLKQIQAILQNNKLKTVPPVENILVEQFNLEQSHAKEKQLQSICALSSNEKPEFKDRLSRESPTESLSVEGTLGTPTKSLHNATIPHQEVSLQTDLGPKRDVQELSRLIDIHENGSVEHVNDKISITNEDLPTEQHMNDAHTNIEEDIHETNKSPRKERKRLVNVRNSKYLMSVADTMQRVRDEAPTEANNVSSRPTSLTEANNVSSRPTSSTEVNNVSSRPTSYHAWPTSTNKTVPSPNSTDPFEDYTHAQNGHADVSDVKEDSMDETDTTEDSYSDTDEGATDSSEDIPAGLPYKDFCKLQAGEGGENLYVEEFNEDVEEYNEDEEEYNDDEKDHMAKYYDSVHADIRAKQYTHTFPGATNGYSQSSESDVADEDDPSQGQYTYPYNGSQTMYPAPWQGWNMPPYGYPYAVPTPPPMYHNPYMPYTPMPWGAYPYPPYNWPQYSPMMDTNHINHTNEKSHKHKRQSRKDHKGAHNNENHPQSHPSMDPLQRHMNEVYTNQMRYIRNMSKSQPKSFR